MSIKIMKLVWCCDQLASSEKFVLLTLADYAKDDGSDVYPSLLTISEKTSLSKMTVIRTIKSLETKGFITTLSVGKYRGQTSSYQINLGAFASSKGTHGVTIKGYHDVTLNQEKGYHGVTEGYHGVTTPIIRTIINNYNAHVREATNTEYEAVTEERKKEEKINEGEQPRVTSEQPTIKPKEDREMTEEKNEIYKMIGIWKETVSNTEEIFLSEKLKNNLQEALFKRCGGSLDKWRGYCDQVSDNAWLMGQNNTGWKAQIIWASKLENIDKVLCGQIYGKKKKIDYKKPGAPIQISKEELAKEIFDSNESEEMKKTRINLLDNLHNAWKNEGMIFYRTYLRAATFEFSEANEKKRLTIHSCYGTYRKFDGSDWHTELLVKTFPSVDEIFISDDGGRDTRNSKPLFIQRIKDKLTRASPETCTEWERLSMEEGIKSFMSISQAALIHACQNSIG